MSKKRIFSGNYSRDMWDAVNRAKTKQNLQEALYFVCCRLQEFESALKAKKRLKKVGKVLL